MMASKLEPSLLRSWWQSYLYLCVFLISSLQSFSPAVMATLWLAAVCEGIVSLRSQLLDEDLNNGSK